MKLSDIKTGLIVMGIIAIIGFSFPLLSTYIRTEPQPYLSLALLNQHNMTEKYFPNEPTVDLDTPLSWNIQVKNIGDTQLVLMKVKIINDLTLLPNTKDCLESPSPVLYEEYIILADNQVITIPFTWRLVSYGAEGIEVEIDGNIVEYGLPVYSGQELSMVFELWVYDLNLRDFVFKWESRTEDQCIWNNITFEVE